MNITKGMTIEYTEPVFTGRYPNGKFSHNRKVNAQVLKDSYGQKTGQHTFTLQVISSDDGELDNEVIRRKGRKVYKDCRVIDYPDDYKQLAEEKDKRREAAKGRKIINNNSNLIPSPERKRLKLIGYRNQHFGSTCTQC